MTGKEIITKFHNIGDAELSLADTQWLIQNIDQAIREKESLPVDCQVMQKTADILKRFIDEPVKYIDVMKCDEKIRQIRLLFCKGHKSEKHLEDIEVYFSILVNIMLNERRAFDDAVKRLHLDVSRFTA